MGMSEMEMKNGRCRMGWSEETEVDDEKRK